MNNPNGVYIPHAADILFGNYIRYDRLFELTKHAFYGRSDATETDIYIDAYSILRSLYKPNQMIIADSNVIASCLINLAIHLRAYFWTRHAVNSRVFIIYGGARKNPEQALSYDLYNFKNIQMEDSNSYLQGIIKDNLDIVNTLTPYLYDIYSVVDYNNEFGVIASNLISHLSQTDGKNNPKIIYSKDLMSYQLVAYQSMCFMYRPKRKMNDDISWVVTKSGLYPSYRYAELGLTKELESSLHYQMFSIYQSLSGIKTRAIPSLKNGTQSIKILEDAVMNNVFANGYNFINKSHQDPRVVEFFAKYGVDYGRLLTNFSLIDLRYQSILYQSTQEYLQLPSILTNLYNPQELRNINDRYFTKYPLDLNRV